MTYYINVKKQLKNSHLPKQQVNSTISVSHSSRFNYALRDFPYGITEVSLMSLYALMDNK